MVVHHLGAHGQPIADGLDSFALELDFPGDLALAIASPKDSGAESCFKIAASIRAGVCHGPAERTYCRVQTAGRSRLRRRHCTAGGYSEWRLGRRSLGASLRCTAY